MSSKQVVRRASNSALRAAARTAGGRVLRRAMANNRLRKAMRKWLRKKQQQARNQIVQRNRGIYNKRFYKIKGMAHGPTHSTTRMIVRRTPRRQKFLRKLFRTNPLKIQYVHRFGFAWMGATAGSKTIWYSCTALKFNNINNYMKGRAVNQAQQVGNSSSVVQSTYQMGNLPDAYIYIGKCTYQYELYNPTNYLVTVYIYDLICKRDTPYKITYSDAYQENSSAPENMMYKSALTQYEQNNASLLNGWSISDPTKENGTTYWNSIGMKPTDYHYFNTFWKVKGMKKIVLAPGEAHHHRVIYNPKVRITQASLYMPRQDKDPELNQIGIGGLTISTLFGFEGQVAVENDQSTDNSTSVGTLPGKLIVNMIRKENIWQGTWTGQMIVQDTKLKDTWTEPKIFTDLIEQKAGAV